MEDAGWERTRATAYDVIRATEVHRYKAVLCENVLEFAVDWELFDWWRKGMEMLGYRSQIVSVSSAHVGGAANLPAPQWRDRIYIVFTRTDIPVPDLAPRPPAWCPECGEDVFAVQTWRNGRRVGKYKQQYDYRCPNTACRRAVVEPYVRPAASIIDWTNLGVRIGDRPAHGLRPLAANTVKRIRAGLSLLGSERMVLTINHGGHDGRAVPADSAPLAARTVKIGDAVLVPAGGTWNTQPTHTAEPMRTRLANPKGFEALLTPPQADDSFIVTLRRNATARPVSTPVDTVTGQGRHHWLVIPYRNAASKSAGEPLHTLGTRLPRPLLHQVPPLLHHARRPPRRTRRLAPGPSCPARPAGRRDHARAGSLGLRRYRPVERRSLACRISRARPRNGRRTDMDVRRDELMPVRQVLAELGGVSRRTFYRWRELGQGPAAFKLPNGELRVWRSDFTSWLRQLEEAA